MGNGSWSGRGSQNLLSEGGGHTRNFQVLCLWKSPHSLPSRSTHLSQHSGFSTPTSPCFADLAGLVYPDKLSWPSHSHSRNSFMGKKKRRESAGGKVPGCSPSPLLLFTPVAHLHRPCWVLGITHLKPGPAPFLHRLPHVSLPPAPRRHAECGLLLLFVARLLGCEIIALVNQIMDSSSNGQLATGGPDSACRHRCLPQCCVLKMGRGRQSLSVDSPPAV